MQEYRDLLVVHNIEEAVQERVGFIQHVLSNAKKRRVVLNLSGGIDSAVVLKLLVLALGAENVFAQSLPYGSQDTSDARAAVKDAGLPAQNYREINIKQAVDAKCQLLEVPVTELIRRGNLMARTRMEFVFDWASELDALVAGTENWTEHLLGYFTICGDSGSIFESIADLLKTQVRQYARYLGVPESIITKAPSANLWEGQTDEGELGVTYDDIDVVLWAFMIDGLQNPAEIAEVTGVTLDVVETVLARKRSQQFKLEIPYMMAR